MPLSAAGFEVIDTDYHAAYGLMFRDLARAELVVAIVEQTGTGGMVEVRPRPRAAICSMAPDRAGDIARSWSRT